MKSINDLIWDPNLDQNKENSENSNSPIVVTPNYIAVQCSGGGGCSPNTPTHAFIGCL